MWSIMSHLKDHQPPKQTMSPEYLSFLSRAFYGPQEDRSLLWETSLMVKPEIFFSGRPYVTYLTMNIQSPTIS